MKKFSKLLAVVVAIAVVVCPMMSIVSSATSTGGYKIEALDENNLKLTISSTDGFIAYSASVGFNSASAFQSTYSSDGYTNGLKLIDYTTKTAAKNSYNTPQISANATGSALNIVVMPSDINNLDLLTEVVIGLRVANGTTASLTKIQAADDGADITEDPTLLSFPAADANTGAIDSTASDYIASNATTNAHSHSFTQQTQTAAYLRTAATCSANATYWYSCATCGLASSTNYFTATGTMLAHTPDNTETYVKADATCTADAQYWQECSVCHQQLSTYWTKPNTALGHSMTYHAATASTCEYQGNDAYYSCSRCGKLFGDNAGANEVTIEEVTRALGDHTASNTKKFLKTAAGCTTDAIYYQECSVCGIQLVTTWTDTGSATGHSFGEYVADGNATCETDGTKTRTCSACGATETVTDTGSHSSVAHTPAAAVTENTVAATCSAAGSYDSVVYCSVCGAEISRTPNVIAKLAHTVVEDAAVAATCTATGLTAGSHCSVCGEVIVAQTVVPATGHSFTYTENGDGTHTVGCANGCGYSATEDCDTEGADGACSKCGYKAATGPVESVLDTNILTNLAPQISITETININFRVAKATTTGNAAYASVKMVITATKYNAGNMTYLADPVYADFWSLTSKNNAATYYDVSTYELDLPIYAYVACYNENGDEIAHSNTFTAYPSELLKGLYTATPTTALQEATNKLVTDTLNLGAAAQTYFAGQVAGETDLKSATAMNEGWDQTYATAELTGLNDVSNFDWNAESAVTSSTNNITTAADISGAPAISYAILRATATGAAPLDYSKLTMEISYETLYANDGGVGTISDVIEGSEWNAYAVGKNLRYSFKKAAMYDSNKTVTAVVTYDGTRVCTVTYSMDSYISAYKDNATVGGIVTAIGKFTATARNYFSVVSGKTV